MKAEEIFDKINEQIKQPMPDSDRFGDGWRNEAKENLSINEVVDIAWKAGRRNVLMEKVIEDFCKEQPPSNNEWAMASSDDLSPAEEIQKIFQSITNDKLREKCLSNFNPDVANQSSWKEHKGKDKSKTRNLLALSILLGFDWKTTKEGVKYWHIIHSLIQAGYPINYIMHKPELEQLDLSKKSVSERLSLVILADKIKNTFEVISNQELREKCLENFDINHIQAYFHDPVINHIGVNNLKRAIFLGFSWENSPEKFDYWDYLYEALSKSKSIDEIMANTYLKGLDRSIKEISKPKEVKQKKKNPEERNYEMLNDDDSIITYEDHILHRIRAIKDFQNGGILIKVGTKGGFIESINNLRDNAWVYDDAQVYGEAQVYDNAKVYGNAKVYDNAQVYGNAKVYDKAKVYGEAKVYDFAEVSGEAQVYNHSEVYNHAKVSGDVPKYITILKYITMLKDK